MPALIDISPSEAVDPHVHALVREYFADFGAAHLDRSGDSMQVHIPEKEFHEAINREGVLGAWQRLRRQYERLGDALSGETELRLRMIRAADLHVEDERRF